MKTEFLPSLRRQYYASTLHQIAHIRLAQAAGFSLTEIGTWMSLGDSPKIDRSALLAKADEIDLAIQRLETIRDGLRNAADCPAPSHAECSKFQALLRVALAGAFDSDRRR